MSAKTAAKPAPAPADSSIATYRAKRDFAKTREPAPSGASAKADRPIFVVQKHNAARARLHYDFRLEHNGVLWSWAIPKGPSMDPADRRMAIHVEDHPMDYAGFSGDIPSGSYGAGSVEIWDSGHWLPLDDPDFGMSKGHLHFELTGGRLNGTFSLVRMKQRGKQEAWLLIKAADATAAEGADAATIEALPQPISAPAEIPGATRGTLPRKQAPQLCTAVDAAPDGKDWISEIKFDGYRLLARIENGTVALLTRNGHDWTERMPHLAQAFAGLRVDQAMLDGELVALDEKGISDFAALQAALSSGRDQGLLFYAFDLLHLNGWDLRPAALVDRKAALHAIAPWNGALRYSDHHAGPPAEMLAQAATSGLEGIVAKRSGSLYRAGRGHGWVKIKCLGREEFVVLGWTPPAGRRVGLGALQIGFYDPEGGLHFAGGVGTGFTDAILRDLRRRLDALATDTPPKVIVGDEPVQARIRWVRPDLVAEIEFTAWSGGGRLRHGVFLGLRDDKAASEVTRAMPKSKSATPPAPVSPPAPARKGRIVVAQAPKRASVSVGGVALSHASRPLWPGITKLDLAEYWQTISDTALRGIAFRPLAILRCPDGIDGEQFFQKNRGGFLPDEIRDATALKQPYLAIDDVAGLLALTQMSAIELHCWGATEADPQHPDRLVFDLDPGEGVAWPEVVQAARDMRDRLAKLKLASFCRTSGGKGLHVVVPLTPKADWPAAKAFCRALAETISAEEPKRFVAHTKIADRRGRILIDWLRNGPGATAIASFSPRARPGATVATPLSWREVTDRLDPKAFTIRTIPGRLAKQRVDPWKDFSTTHQTLPALPPAEIDRSPVPERKPGASRIVVARKPSRRP